MSGHNPLTDCCVQLVAPPCVAAVLVAEKTIGLPVKLPADTETAFAPAAAPKVSVVEARPLLLLEVDATVRLPPPLVTLKVTTVPATGLPLLSVTSTVNGLPNCCPVMPFWPLPLTIISFDAAPDPPAKPVAEKLIGLPLNDPAVAVTIFVPAAGPRTNVVEAMPLLLVTAVPAVSEPPPALTVKFTVTPETGFPPASVTSTENGKPRAWLTVPDCPLPPIEMRFAAVPEPPVVPPARYAFKLKSAATSPVVPVTNVYDWVLPADAGAGSFETLRAVHQVWCVEGSTLYFNV